MFEELFKKMKWDLEYKNPDIDPELNTYRSLIVHDDYKAGNFLTRIFNRFDFSDDFRHPHIASVGYNPTIRKISFKINPYLYWHAVVRPNVISIKDLASKVHVMDKYINVALKDGGWTLETFSIWKNYLLSPEVTKIKSNLRRNRYESRETNIIVTSILSVIIHEIMHVLWNHVDKRKLTNDKDPEQLFNHRIANIAQDFAINQTLSFGVLDGGFMTTKNEDLLKLFKNGGAPMKDVNIKSRTIDIELFDDMFLNQPAEYYFDLLKKNKKEDLEKMTGKIITINVSGVEMGVGYFAGFGHDQFEGFGEETQEAKKVATNDMKRVIEDMMEKGELDDPSEICNQRPFDLNKYFAKVVEGLFKTETISWEHILRHYIFNIIGCLNYSYTMKRECRGLPDMFPGKERLEGLDLNIVMDVSGSIVFEDYNRFVNEIERIAREVEHPYVRFIQFHSDVSLDKLIPLKQVRNVGVPSTGGTCMKAPLDLLKKEKNKKLTIVFTDGYVESEVTGTDYDYKIILFLSASANDYVAERLRERGFIVLHQDGKNEWFQKTLT